jgi:hypothetical protein
MSKELNVTYKRIKFFKNTQYGSSALEVIFAIAIVLIVTPFMYNQISEMSQAVHDVSFAKQVTGLRDGVLNYVRVNQGSLSNGDVLDEEVLDAIAPGATLGLVTKTSIGDGNMGDSANIEIFLVFDPEQDKYRVANIAKYIGPDAAVVQNDDAAYAKNWAVSLANIDGNYKKNLIYRIARDFSEEDKSLYLHKTGDSGFNVMERDLHMHNNDIVNVADFVADQAFKVYTLSASLIKKISEKLEIKANSVYFPIGATFQNSTLNFNSLEIHNGLHGFSDIYTNSFCNSDLYCGDNGITTIEAHIDNFIKIPDNFIAGKNDDDTAYSQAYFSGFNINGNLTSPNVETHELVFKPYADMVVSGEFISHDNFSSQKVVAFVIGDSDSGWKYTYGYNGPTFKGCMVRGRYGRDVTFWISAAPGYLNLCDPDQVLGCVRFDIDDGHDILFGPQYMNYNGIDY